MIEITQILSQVKNKISQLDAEILLAYVLKVERVHLKAYPNKILSSEQLLEFNNLVKRRIEHEPTAYIIGNKNFWDLNLIVTKDVLIPRQETEILVEQALIKLPNDSSIKVLELGTGSGAVALAIAKHLPKITVIATDCSKAALTVAKLNAKLLNITNIKFFYGNWFNALRARLDSSPTMSAQNDERAVTFKFDLIISNPPYISPHEINLCGKEIFYEPKIALFADHNGIACFEEIIYQSTKYLKANGYLLLEHGFKQKDQIISLLKTEKFVEIKNFLDLYGLDRAVIAKKSN